VAEVERVESMMAKDPALHRMIAVTLVLTTLVTANSMTNDERPGMTVAMAAAVLAGGAFIIGCYLWARRTK
jgi:hypothetical protein